MDKIIIPQLMDQILLCGTSGILGSAFAVMRNSTKVLIGGASFKMSVAVAYWLSGFSVGFFTGAIIPADHKYWLAIVIASGYFSVKIIDLGFDKVGTVFDKFIKRGL